MLLLWKIVWKFLKKLKMGLPYDWAIPLLDNYTKNLNAGTETILLHPHHSIHIHNSQKMEMTQMSVNWWRDQKSGVNTMEYYSALSRKEILTLVTTWMSFEDAILSEINQSQMDKYCLIPPYKVTRAVKFT